MGETVKRCWYEMPTRFPQIRLDAFVIMPNHVHGIIVLVGTGCHVGAGSPRPHVPPPTESASVAGTALGAETAPLQAAPAADTGLGAETAPPRGTLGQMVAYFKYGSTECINERRGTLGLPVWQRSYYEHIIRNDDDWDRIREYIVANLLHWAWDQENPDALGHGGALRPDDAPSDFVRAQARADVNGNRI